MKSIIHALLWISSLLLLQALALPAAVTASTSQLHVSATVTPWLEFSAQQHVQFYRVEPADLDRGFVDLPRALTIEVQSNVRHPIAFRVLGNSGQAIKIRESGGSFSAPGGNLLMVNNAGAQQALRKSLDVRVLLSEQAEPGRYPLMTTLIPEAY